MDDDYNSIIIIICDDEAWAYARVNICDLKNILRGKGALGNHFKYTLLMDIIACKRKCTFPITYKDCNAMDAKNIKAGYYKFNKKLISYSNFIQSRRLKRALNLA